MSQEKNQAHLSKRQFSPKLQNTPIRLWPKKERNLYHKLWKRGRTEQIREASRNYRLKNPDKVRQSLENYRNNNPDKVKALARKHAAKQYRLNGDEIRKRNRIYSHENKEKNLTRSIAWQKSNRERRRGTSKRWADKNRHKILAHFKLRSTTDLNFYLRNKLRARVRMAIVAQHGKKAHRTMKLVGCSVEVLRQWLESQFDEYMTWENCGKHWVIDHVTPVVVFDLKQESEQLRAFHYTNCQPLEKHANLIKSDSMPNPAIVITPRLR